MKVLQEYSEWATDYSVPNHIYFVNDSKDKMFAYCAENTDKVTEFKSPLPFSTTRRKFKEIENTFNYVYKDIKKPSEKSYQVQGTKGFYTVTEEDNILSCTCTGFKFYSKCKHVDSIKQQLNL